MIAEREVTIKLVDTFIALVCDNCVGFLKFTLKRKQRAVENIAATDAFAINVSPIAHEIQSRASIAPMVLQENSIEHL